MYTWSQITESEVDGFTMEKEFKYEIGVKCLEVLQLEDQDHRPLLFAGYVNGRIIIWDAIEQTKINILDAHEPNVMFWNALLCCCC